MPMQNYQPLYEYTIPEIVRDPLKLYERDPDFIDKPFWEHRGLYAGFYGAGATLMLGNHLMRRPIYSSIHHIMAISAGVGLLWYGCQKLHEKYALKRDQIYRHYIMLHPEDFKPEPPRRLGEIYALWEPCR